MPDTHETLEEAILRLQRENKKLSRKIAQMEGTMRRSQEALLARESLNAFIEAEKSRQEKYMTLLLDNCPDIIFLLDAAGRFAYSADVFLKQAGIASFGLINGRTYQEVFTRFATKEWIERFASAYAQAIDSRQDIVMEEILDIQGGNPRNFTIRITPMKDEHNVVEGALVLFHDLTDLLRAKDQAETANTAKSDFLTTVSHEIRTPMNAIIGLADMLSQSPLTEKQQTYLDGIHNASAVLLSLINDILDFSKIEAGKLILEKATFSLHRLLEHLETMFTLMFEEKHIAFSMDIDPCVPEIVYADEKRVQQILMNLLNNALKYTEKGQVSLRVRMENDVVRFDVRDTGVGIRKSDQARLFRPFEQLDRVRNKRVSGTGLGLVITHKLCQLMDGSIQVKSTYGQGSTFTVRLPLPGGEASSLEAEPSETISFEAPDAKVLVVDDIEINLLVAEAILETFGVHPALASSGKEALALCRTETFDLIFMDHMMPEMDGVEVTEQIRSTAGPNQRVPIVALTANAVSGAKEMFLVNGFTDFLSKPINRSTLGARLLQWLPPMLVKTET